MRGFPSPLAQLRYHKYVKCPRWFRRHERRSTAVQPRAVCLDFPNKHQFAVRSGHVRSRLRALKGRDRRPTFLVRVGLSPAKGRQVSESEAFFGVMRQSADPASVAAIEQTVREATDRDLCRVNVLDFAAKHGLDEERALAAFLHASRLGLFELSWNVLCPGCCGGLFARPN